MTRKQLFLTTGVLTTFFIALVVAIFFFGLRRPASTLNDSPSDTNVDYGYLVNNTGDLATEGNGEDQGGKTTASLRVLSDGAVAGFWLYNNHPLYITSGGEIYDLSAESGAPEIVSSEKKPGVHNVVASPDGASIIVFQKIRERTLGEVFSVENSQWTPLNNKAIDAEFLTNASIVSVRSLFDGSALLETTDLQTNEVVVLKELSLQDIDIQPLTSNLIVFTSFPSFYSAASAYLYNIEGDTISPVALEKRGLSLIWSPSGERALAFWAESESDNRSAVIDNRGNIKSSLQTALLPQKCTFANETSIICAVPSNTSISSMSVMPDSYLQHEIQTTDIIIKLDIKSGRSTTLYADPAASLDIYAPLMYENVLYFINRYDNKLYSLIFPEE